MGGGGASASASAFSTLFSRRRPGRATSLPPHTHVRADPRARPACPPSSPSPPSLAEVRARTREGEGWTAGGVLSARRRQPIRLPFLAVLHWPALATRTQALPFSTRGSGRSWAEQARRTCAWSRRPRPMPSETQQKRNGGRRALASSEKKKKKTAPPSLNLPLSPQARTPPLSPLCVSRSPSHHAHRGGRLHRQDRPRRRPHPHPGPGPGPGWGRLAGRGGFRWPGARPGGVRHRGRPDPGQENGGPGPAAGG